MKMFPMRSLRTASPGHTIEPLEARIAPANFVLPSGQGPFTLEVDPLDSHIHIRNGAAVEIFDQGAGPADDLFVTGGAAGDAFTIANSGAGNIAFTGTLSVVIPGQINVTASVTTGADFELKSLGAGINYGTAITLGTSAAHFTAARNILFANNSALTADSGDIVLQANQGPGQNGTFIGIQLDHATIRTTGGGAILLTGTGGNVSGNNVGIALANDSMISSTSTLAAAGAITLTGNAGQGNVDNNHGVFLAGPNTLITSVRGAISITGFGNGAGTNNNVGVLLSNGAQVTTSGTLAGAGTITVIGQGGGGGASNYGVFLDGSALDPKISTVTGTIMVTGTGDPAAAGANSRGISIEQGGQVLATGNGGAITLIGNGGGGSGGRQGVFVSDAGSLVSALDGVENVTGTGGSGGAVGGNNGVLVMNGGKLSVSGAGTRTLSVTGIEGGGPASEGVAILGVNSLIESLGGSGLSVVANNLNIDPAGSINSGPGVAKLRPRTAGNQIDLGGADVFPGTLGVTNAELNRIAASAVLLGDATTGAIVLSTAFTVSTSLGLTSGATISGAFTLGMQGAANLNVNGAAGVDLSGPVTLAGGVFTISCGAAATASVNNAGNNFGTVNIPGAGSVNLRDDSGFALGAASVSTLLTIQSAGAVTQSGILSGTGGLSKLGTGTFTLSSANTYGSATSIGGGTLKLGAPNVIPDGASAGDVTLSPGASLDVNGFDETINGLAGNGSVLNSGPAAATLSIGGSNATTTFDGSITGMIAVTKIGAGTLTLSNPGNSYTGATTVNAGTFQVGTLGAIPNGGVVVVNAGTLDLNGFDETVSAFTLAGGTVMGGVGKLTSTTDFDMRGGTISAILAGNVGLAVSGSTPTTITSSATYTGATAVNSGSLVVNGALANTSSVTVAAGAVLSGAGSVSGSVGNAGTLLAASGTFTIAGNLNQTGGTTSLAGGGISAAGVVNFTGGVLTGAGTITGNVNNTGATVRPGGTGAAGTITITGNYTQGAGAVLAMELGGVAAGQFDALSVGAIATLDGTLNTTALAGFNPPTLSTYQLVDAATRTGTFASTNLPPGFTATYTPTGMLAAAPFNPLEVTTTNDVVNAGDAVNSLREAILFANGNPGLDTITFNIAGGGVQRIAPASALPAVTEAVVIDGYSQPGASVNSATTGTNAVLLIELNGVNAGAAASGLTLNSAGSTIRGLVINGFSAHGILVTGPASGGNTIAGNFIGTNATGTTASANGQSGVAVDGATTTTIGGAAQASRNLISGNTDAGITITRAGAHDTTVLGNLIGTTATGAVALANGVGVTIGAGAASSTIGSTAAGAGNVIAFNAGAGVAVTAADAAGTSIRGNSIHANGGLGIDLGPAGVTANDPLDTDTGANGLQNFPVLASATTSGNTTTFSGTFASAAGGTFLIDFYASATGDPTGFGEGQTFLGSTAATTNAAGDFTFNFTPTTPPAQGTIITATATDSAGNTSEFGGGVALNIGFVWDAGAGADTSWFNPLNWDRDSGTPGAADTATLGIAATMTVGADATVGVFHHSAGTLGGAANLTIVTSYDWTGGSMADGGSTTIAAGGTLAISGSGVHQLSGRTIANRGTIAWTAKGLLSGDTAANVIDNNDGGIFDAQGDVTAVQAGAGTLTINNAANATFLKSGVATTAALGANTTFNNAGTVTVLAGTLNLPGGASGGGFVVASGAVLNFIGSAPQTLGPTSSVSGTGAVSVSGGTVLVGGSYSILIGTTITAGTLRFDAPGAGLDGPFTLAGGTLGYDLPGPADTLNPLLTLAADSTIDVAAGKTVTLASLISGAGGLTKTGAGTLILGNQLNSFGPALVKISGGVLQVPNDGALGDVANDVRIDNATFAASTGFASARNFTKTGGVATIDAQAPKLALINKAIVPADLTPTIPANLIFAIEYLNTENPGRTVTVGNTAVSLGGKGMLTIHKASSTTIDTIELSGTDSTTKLIITGEDPTQITTVLRIVIDDPGVNTIASIGSIVLGKNVRLGDGIRDSVPDLYVEGTTGKLQLYDINQYAVIDLGEGLPHGVTGDRKTPSTKTNAPSLTMHEVLGPGVLIDLTPSDLPPDTHGDLVGGGGLGKVVVGKWSDPGFVRTTQSIKSFKLVNGDCYVVFELDKHHVGSDTQANCGNMTIQNGSWGSSGSEMEGDCGSFNADAFLAGATLTCGSMGKFGLDAGAFAGLLTITDPDAPGIPTFTVNSDFTGTVDSEAPLRKIKVKGDFMGTLEAPFIGSITAYSFLGAAGPGNTITATDGSLGTLTATAGVVRNFTIVTDQAFKGFNVKLGKLGADTVGIDNVHIEAASIGNISVSLAAAAFAPGVDLTGIRDSEFITTGNGATKLDAGNIGNVTVTLTGGAGGASAAAIENCTFDALVLANEFAADPAASTVNALGKIAVKVSGQDGASLGLENASFSANSIGPIALSVSKGKGGGTAHAVETAVFTAAAANPAASGSIASLSIDGDATETQAQDLKVSADANVGAVSVKAKTAAFGTLDSSTILAGQALDMTGSADLAKLARASLGAVTLTGSLTNSRLAAGGSIGAVTVGKDLTDSSILAGVKLGGDFLLDGDETYQRTAAIAAITVKGNFARTSIAAGVNPGNFTFGDSDTPAANLAGTSAIGPIVIAGSVATGPASVGSHQFAIEAATIKSLKIGAAPVLTNFSSALFIDSAVPGGDDAGDVVVRLI